MVIDTNDTASGAGPPLFIVSFRQRDELAHIAAAAGWHATLVGEADGLEQRLLDSGAAVVLVDARGALDLGLDAARSLARWWRPPAVRCSRWCRVAMSGASTNSTMSARPTSSPARRARARSRPRCALLHVMLRARGATIDRREPPSAWQHDGNAGVARRWLAAALGDPVRPVSVLLLALSRLDFVNAAYGRPAVDALIEAAGRRLRAVVEAQAGARTLAVRIGGAEFVVAVEADAAGIEAISATLDEALARPFPVERTLAVLGSRVGIATRAPSDDAAALLHRASEALAAAKASDGVVHTAAVARVAPLDTLAVDLHHAIDRARSTCCSSPRSRSRRGA